MADDFGDDAGDKLLEWSMRIMIERGRLHARESSAGLARALRDAQERVSPGGGAPQGEERNGWAKLDVRDLASVEGWDDVRAAIDAELDARGIAHEWFEDGRTGERRLLFRTGDARGLADSLGSLAEKVEAAHEQAARASGAPARRRRRSGTEATPGRNRSLRDRVRTVRRYAEGPREGGPRRAGAGARREPREGAVVMRATPPAALAAVAAASALASRRETPTPACLASLGGAWAGNLAPALAALPAYVAAHGPVTPGQGPLLAGAVCAGRRVARLEPGGARRRQLPPGRGARKRPVAPAGRGGEEVLGHEGPGQQHHPHAPRRARRRPVAPQEGVEARQERPRHRGHRQRQDVLVRDAQRAAGKPGLPHLPTPRGTLSRDLGGMFAPTATRSWCSRPRTHRGPPATTRSPTSGPPWTSSSGCRRSSP